MRFLRGMVISVGLGVLGLLGVVELVFRSRDARTAAHVDNDDDDGDVDLVAGTSGPPVSRAVSKVRMVVGVIGVAVAVYGVYLVVRTVPGTSYLAIAIWLAAAVILHDAVLVPVVSLLREATIRVGRRLPAASLVLIEGAFVVGGVLSLVAVPEIWAKHLGSLNPTVLPGAYGQALVVTWLVLAILTVGSIATLARLPRRQPTHRIEPARSALKSHG